MISGGGLLQSAPAGCVSRPSRICASGISSLRSPCDYSHEDTVLADEMMEKRRPNMRRDKAGHGNADQPVN